MATSGNLVFLGTDSALMLPIPENACLLLFCFNALPLYATAFDSVGKIDRLEGFASQSGHSFIVYRE